MSRITPFKIIAFLFIFFGNFFYSHGQVDTTKKEILAQILKKTYYVEAGSYGTKRESDPPIYVKNLSQTGLESFKNINFLDFGLDYRARFEYRKNDIRRAYLTTDVPFLLRTRVYLGVKNIIDPFRFVIELEDAHRVNGKFSKDDRDFNRAALIQAFGELNFKKFLNKDFFGNERPVFLRFGRQAFEFLDRRLIGSNQWRNTTNNFMGFRGAIGQDKNAWSLDVLALKPINRKVSTIDEISSDKNFWAIIWHWRKWSESITIEPYYLGLSQKAMATNAFKNRLVHSPGLRIYGWLGAKHLNYDITYTRQFGSDAGQRIHAFAFTSEFGYKFNQYKWKPRVSIFYGHVSGDKNASDKTQNRFERFYGFARPWSSDDYIIPENIITPKIKIELEPIKGFKVDGGYSYYWLASGTDRFNNLLNGNKNRDVTGNSGRFLGHGLDIRGRFSIAKLIDTNVGYTHFTNGDFVLKRQTAALGLNAPTSNFAYVEVNINVFDLVDKL